MLLASFLLVLTAPWPATCPVQQEKPAPEEGADGEPKVERVRVSRGKDMPPLFMEWTLANDDPETPTLVLLHAARSGKAEYRPMVPRLKELGYNCLAVDLMHGTESRGVKNNTAKAARDAGRNVNYLDAIGDILDAVKWARDNHAKGKLLLWGSSFSASLALHLAAEHGDQIDGVIAFSPGEYFGSVGKGTTWIQECAKQVKCPVFVTSAKNEEHDWRPIFEALAASDKTAFVPAGPGTHGAKALWQESAGNAEYWTAVESFLKRVCPASTPVAK